MWTIWADLGHEQAGYSSTEQFVWFSKAFQERAIEILAALWESTELSEKMSFIVLYSSTQIAHNSLCSF